MTDAQRAIHELLDLPDPPEMRQRLHTRRVDGKPDRAQQLPGLAMRYAVIVRAERMGELQ